MSGVYLGPPPPMRPARSKPAARVVCDECGFRGELVDLKSGLAARWELDRQKIEHEAECPGRPDDALS